MKVIKLYINEDVTIKLIKTKQNIYQVIATDKGECYYSNHFVFQDVANNIYKKIVQKAL